MSSVIIKGYTPKLINSAAAERNKDSLLFSIYDKCAPKTKAKIESIGAGLVVQGGRIRSKLTGFISKDMNSLYQNYGKGYSG